MNSIHHGDKAVHYFSISYKGYSCSSAKPPPRLCWAGEIPKLVSFQDLLLEFHPYVVLESKKYGLRTKSLILYQIFLLDLLKRNSCCEPFFKHAFTLSYSLSALWRLAFLLRRPELHRRPGDLVVYHYVVRNCGDRPAIRMFSDKLRYRPAQRAVCVCRESDGISHASGKELVGVMPGVRAVHAGDILCFMSFSLLKFICSNLF